MLSYFENIFPLASKTTAAYFSAPYSKYSIGRGFFSQNLHFLLPLIPNTVVISLSVFILNS
jgi:hypothetical protein